MFSSLFFLIMVLLILNLAVETDPASALLEPSSAFAAGMLIFVAVLSWIILQNRLCLRHRALTRNTLLILANLELVSFLIVYHLVLQAHAFYLDTSELHTRQTFLAAASLLLYFVGLGAFHASSYTPSASDALPLTRRQYVSMQLRFLLPFCLPFLLFEAIIDFFEWTELGTNGAFEWINGDPMLLAVSTFSGAVLFLGALMVFLPAVIQFIWGCRPLQPSPLTTMLQDLCRRAKFRHAGLKIWTVMNHSLTAAIIGIVPMFRYIMFTEGLLKRLPPEQIEAVLAHEIGHSQRRHLIIFPFIIMGMIVSTGLFFLFFGDSIFEFVSLKNRTFPDSWWDQVPIFAFFVPFAAIAALYFRFVFGFFSRQFERQADLHVYEVGVSPEHMTGALHSIGVFSGWTHRQPNWHHYSIQQRIDYLDATMDNPGLIKKHHRKVKRLLRTYFVLLICGVSLLLSPSIPALGFASDRVEAVSDSLRDLFNGSGRRRAARSMIARHGLEGDQRKLEEVLVLSLSEFELHGDSGLVELVAAERFHIQGMNQPSLVMLEQAWSTYDFSRAPRELVENSIQLTKQVIEAALIKQENLDQIQRVIQAMRSQIEP